MEGELHSGEHTVKDEKAGLRKRFRAVLVELDPTQGAASSTQIAAHIAKWLAGKTIAGRIALYAAKPPEAELRPLHELVPDGRFVYPRVTPDGLKFHAVSDPAELVPGTFGILEPHVERHPQVELDEIALVLCPGLAFSGDGVRLGRGGGHYDRALSLLRKGIPRLGVGYEIQHHAKLPDEEHDIRMTHLASECGVIRVK